MSSTACAFASPREVPRWARNISAIWCPTVKTGFSDDNASWKTIEMPGPRIFRCCSVGIFSMSSPRNRIAPRVTKPGGESRIPMIA
jgi:hypothetical protein